MKINFILRCIVLVSLLAVTASCNSLPRAPMLHEKWERLHMPYHVHYYEDMDICQVWVRLPPSYVVTFPKNKQIIVTYGHEIDYTIDNADDLHGRVDITTPSHAIDFVRLFSSRITVTTMPEWKGWEISESGKVLEHDFTLPDSIIQQVQPKDIQCTFEEDVWTIRRFILRADFVDIKWEIIEIEEQVTRNGKYTVRDIDIKYEGKIEGFPYAKDMTIIILEDGYTYH